MGVFLCLALPIIAFVVIMLVCKWSNFSIIPEDLKLKTPKKYKFPKISRGEDYKWEAHYSSDEEESSDDDDILFDYPSESESEDSDSSSESDDSDSSDSETETVFF
jgi:hypothetical protein